MTTCRNTPVLSDFFTVGVAHAGSCSVELVLVCRSRLALLFGRDSASAKISFWRTPSPALAETEAKASDLFLGTAKGPAVSLVSNWGTRSAHVGLLLLRV